MTMKNRKFIIEVAEEVTRKDGTKLYPIKGFNSLVFDDYGLEKLIDLGDEIEKVAYENYDHGCTDGYKRGIKEAWIAARKIVGQEIDVSSMMDMFKDNSYRTPFLEYEAQDVLSKINEYEARLAKEESKINIGDEVAAEGDLFYVTSIMESGCVSGIDYKGEAHSYYLDQCTKTGRHNSSIEVMVDDLKEGDNSNV